ncbi:hypothetical protein SDC9_153166 [bioreactor metagenome]|uniref:Uncharacterized protein n=1 Tax=bioreactor metagenome TaxID=1076179 RepID=A0A645EXF1_9ZZZZ
MVLPASHLQRGQTERNGATEREDRVLAGEVVGGCLRHIDGVGLQRIHHAESGHQLACGVHRDFKLAARHGLDGCRQLFSTAEDRVQRLGEAGCQAPAHCSLRVDGWGNTCCEHASNTGLLDDGTTIHEFLSERFSGMNTINKTLTHPSHHAHPRPS